MHLLTFFILISFNAGDLAYCGMAYTAADVAHSRLPQDSQRFEAKVDGQDFRPDEFWAHAGGGIINIQADDMDEAGFMFVLPDDIAEGAHELSYDTADFIQCLYGNGYDSGEPESGTLHITRHDQEAGRVEGRFSFQGTFSEGDKFAVTDGRFALDYK